MATQMSIHVYLQSHNLFDSHGTCLKNLMSYVIKIHVDSLLNLHVMGSRKLYSLRVA